MKHLAETGGPIRQLAFRLGRRRTRHIVAPCISQVHELCNMCKNTTSPFENLYSFHLSHFPVIIGTAISTSASLVASCRFISRGPTISKHTIIGSSKLARPERLERRQSILLSLSSSSNRRHKSSCTAV